MEKLKVILLLDLKASLVDKVKQFVAEFKRVRVTVGFT